MDETWISRDRSHETDREGGNEAIDKNNEDKSHQLTERFRQASRSGEFRVEGN